MGSRKPQTLAIRKSSGVNPVKQKDHMKSQHAGNSKRCTPSFLGKLSMYVACSSADNHLPELKETLRIYLTSQMRSGILREQIFFHFFMALDYIRYAFNNPQDGRVFIDQFLESIKNGDYRSELESLNYFSIESQEKAIQESIFGFGRIPAVMAQGLYLERHPNEKERRIIDDLLFDGEASFNPDCVGNVQYFMLALTARLSNVLNIEPRTFNCLQLYLLTSAHAIAAAKAYRKCIRTSGCHGCWRRQAPSPRQVKTGWLSRLIK